MSGFGASAGSPTPRRYRPRRIDLGADGALALLGSGRIEHHDAADAVVGAWNPGDPDWPRHAIRFGLRETRTTIAPSGRGVAGTRPPR